MAIDLRLRPPAKGFLSMHVYTRSGTDYAPGRPGRHPGTIGREEAQSVKEQSLEILFEEMDEVGITHGVLPGREAISPYNGYPNDDIYDLVREYPHRFIGLPHANPHDRKSAFGEIDRASDTEGIPGIHLEPGWIADPRHANDPLLYPLYERCAEKGLVAAISGGGWIGPDFNYVNPVDIQQVAKAFPELTLVVCHAGWPWIDVMIGDAFNFRRCWYDGFDRQSFKKKEITTSSYFAGDRNLKHLNIHTGQGIVDGIQNSWSNRTARERNWSWHLP